MTGFRILIISLLVWLLLVCNIFGQTPYNFEIIARTGAEIDGFGPITDLGAGPSINDAGKIAFIARDDSGINGRVMVVSDGKLERNFLIPPTERIGTDVQINNLDQVVWWREIEAPGSALNQDTLVQRLDTENSGEIIARGTITDWFNTIWDYVLPWATINNNGVVFFTGDTDPNKVPEELRGTVLASRDGGSGSYQMTTPFSNFPNFFPMASDNNRVVIRRGNDVTDTLWVFVETTLDPKVALDVATAADFNIIGSKPGISDDGRVVVFMGDSKTEGPGIYMAAINVTGNAFVRFKVADISGSNPALPMRVSVNQSNSEPFDYKVVYLANTPRGGPLGLFVVRVDVTNPFDRKIIEPPTLLVKVGSTIDGAEYLGKIQNIGLYDPVNNKGQIAFWVDTDIGSKAIVRNCLDSDGDSLCDSWETDGIKDADGNVILDLPAMGADPDYKDIFVEVDYMGNIDAEGNIVGHTHLPKKDAITKVVNAFLDAPVDCEFDDPENCKGIRLHVDFGQDSVMNSLTGETWGVNSRSESLTHISRFAPSCFTSPPSDECMSEFYGYVDNTIKDHFIRFNGGDELTRREIAFHYAMFVHESMGASGVSPNAPESWFIVSLASIDKCEFDNDNSRGTINQQAGTFMHELGHNLGLSDCGSVVGPDNNCDYKFWYKPNYLSVMNYLFQLNGLIINQNHPKHPGPSSPNELESLFDYSRFDVSQIAILDEEALDESVGLGAAAHGYGTRYFCSEVKVDRPCGVVEKPSSVTDATGPIDWNCEGPADEDNVSTSINADVEHKELKSYNDWKNLIFGGGGYIKSITMGTVAPMELILNELRPEEAAMIPRHYAVAVIAPMGFYFLPGGSTTYDFKVRNIGDNSDTYTLHATSSHSWAEVGTFPQTVTLEPGQEAVVSIDIAVPSEASGGETDELKLKALSQANPLLLDTASVITEVSHLQNCEGDFNYDFDVDGSDLLSYIADSTGIRLDVFSIDFGRTDCPGSD